MLQRDSKPISTYGFLVAVEIEKGVDPQWVAQKLGDALLWSEGIGTVDVETLGIIEIVNDDAQPEGI